MLSSLRSQHRLLPLAARVLVGLLGCVAAPTCACAQPALRTPQSTDPPPFPEPSQPPPPPDREHGFVVGVRAAFGLPLGQAADGAGSGRTDLSRAFTGVVPIELGVGYRPTPFVYFGLFIDYAIGVVASGPDASCTVEGGVRCRGGTLRAGVELQVHVLPGLRVDPWLGVGAAYESMTFAIAPGERGSSFDGIEFVNGQAGVDFRLSRRLRLGPYAVATLGRYSTVTRGTGADAQAGPVINAAFHGWALFGLRTAYLF